ncbi:methyltransferase [Planktotalea sp.]|uniref:methyltransferase n=1 Tax=Planktotalea sp. TaxID=2029877 RepID=UPI0032976F26
MLDKPLPTANAASPRLALMKIALGGWLSQATYAAAKLGLVEIIGDGALTPHEIAGKAGTDPDVSYRLLRALASVGLFVEDEDGRFSVTPVGECLSGERPDSLLPLVTMMGEEFHKVWGDIVPSIQTGEPAFPRVFGESFFEFLQDHNSSGTNFDACMATLHGAEADHVVDTFDFSPYRKIADIGGGKGSLLCTILRRHEEAEGILYDLPEVIERAKVFVGDAGMSERCTLIPGSFFETVPDDADLYVLRHIIHDWDDAKSVQILKNCAAKMKPGAKLLIIDCVIPAGNDWFPGKFIDLHMLLLAGGKERTGVEFGDVLKKAGLNMKQILPTPIPRVSIVEAELAAPDKP